MAEMDSEMDSLVFSKKLVKEEPQLEKVSAISSEVGSSMEAKGAKMSVEGVGASRFA